MKIAAKTKKKNHYVELEFNTILEAKKHNSGLKEFKEINEHIN